jgi:excisionase family DNA binding protein
MVKAADAPAAVLAHECVNGETVEYPEPARDVAKFLERVRRAADDAAVSEDALIALIYGRENPLLDHTMLPGRSMVTPAVFANPLYRVLVDLLDRKRVQSGALDLAKARARYTLSVTDAAAQLGVNATAVRKAIGAGRLPALKDGGQYWLDPASVASFEVDRRGPSPRLEIRMGSAPGESFRVKHPTHGNVFKEIAAPAANVRAGELTNWKRVAVMTTATRGDTKSARLFVLEPGGPENEVALGAFHVRGRFTVAEKINNPERAAAAWKAFEPE